jgi:hypothetical protein
MLYSLQIACGLVRGGQEKPYNISYFAALAGMDVTNTQVYPCCQILNWIFIYAF